MNADRHALNAESLRRAAAALAEALPILLLAAALLAPALAAITGDEAPRVPSPELGRAIAEQGNRALLTIRADTREAVRHMAPPALPAYAVAGAPQVVAQNR